MASITFDELEKVSQKRGILESFLFKSAAKSTYEKRVFLSYSTLDYVYVDQVMDFFKDAKAAVYIDCGDDRLPHIPSPQTAELLKDAINACPRFVVMLSENSKASKWVPWELGLADGLKGLAPVALFTIGKTFQEETWEKQEYLGLYPRITKVLSEWRVHDPRDNSQWSLASWLHQTVT